MTKKGLVARQPFDLPMTPAQLRLWFLNRLTPGDTAYNLVTAVRLEGPMNPHAIAASATGLLREHAGLLSRFDIVSTIPTQRFGLSVAPPIRVVDLSALTEGETRAALAGVLAELAGTPIDLTSGPVASWLLVREHQDRHVLVFAAHHIVFDGGSLDPLSSGLTRRYIAATAGQPAGVRGVAMKTGNDASCGLPASGESTVQSTAYWQRTLAGAPPRVEVFETPKGRPAPQRGAPACTVRFMLGGIRTATLRQLAAAERCTSFVTLLTIFATLVSRYADQDDVVIGTPISLHDAEHQQIGLNLNMLPLRLRAGDDQTVRAGMSAARDVVLDAFCHRDLPFEALVEAIAVPRGLNYSPIFQVVFAHQAMPRVPALPGLRTSVLPVDPAAAKYPLTVVVTEMADDLEIAVQADLAATERDAVELLAANFDLLISGALARPDQRLNDVPMLADPGRTRARNGGEAGSVPLTAFKPEARGPVTGRSLRTGLEQEIAGVWASILETASVHPELTFFEQGGSSLSLLRLHAALDVSIAPGLALTDLFRFPSVRRLAEHLDSQGPAGDVTATSPPDHAADAAARGARRRERIASPRRG